MATLVLARETDPETGRWLDVAAATGARRGEICALRWSNIDLDRQTVRIERSVSATKEHGVFIKTTKTDRFRLVSLTDQATQSLIALRRAVLGRDKHRSAVRPRVRERIESCVAVAS